jgi:K+-transporting ATPase c subunit
MDQLQTLVQKYIQMRQFGFFGEQRVNVLALNQATDQMFGKIAK